MLSIIQNHKKYNQFGITSVCSANKFVLKAAIKNAKKFKSKILIEATSNQVDQFGGYTGMTPEMFKTFVLNILQEENFPVEDLILGGDHLGPNRWQHLNAQEAMQNADGVIEAYVAAGFQKIHLDCSMSCKDDPVLLTDEIIAQRVARLAKVSEETAKRLNLPLPVYVIGTEVPVPGGEKEDIKELHVTDPQAARKTIDTHRKAFTQQGLVDIWSRVIGLVVQPGVEFDHTKVVDFKRELSTELSKVVDEYEYLVFEAHSTDYQTAQAYKELVKQHFAILKVGPALTFALREALFALADIEEYLFPSNERSNLKTVLEQTMLENPNYWNKYYFGSELEQKMSRSFSLSDRIRYYWSMPVINDTVEKLFNNFKDREINLPLLSQYFPDLLHLVRSGELKPTALNLTLGKIEKVLEDYSQATIN